MHGHRGPTSNRSFVARHLGLSKLIAFLFGSLGRQVLSSDPVAVELVLTLIVAAVSLRAWWTIGLEPATIFGLASTFCFRLATVVLGPTTVIFGASTLSTLAVHVLTEMSVARQLGPPSGRRWRFIAG